MIVKYKFEDFMEKPSLHSKTNMLGFKFLKYRELRVQVQVMYI